MRTLIAPIATVACALLIAACGSEGVSVPESDTSSAAGAEIFASHCAGCHTLGPAGTQGSGNRSLRVQGPNFDERVESYDDALFAIRNGGFSGAIMPQNIVVGEDASLVAEFLSKYSGNDVVEQPRPTATSSTTETGEANAVPSTVEQGTEGNSGTASSEGTAPEDEEAGAPSASGSGSGGGNSGGGGKN